MRSLSSPSLLHLPSSFNELRQPMTLRTSTGLRRTTRLSPITVKPSWQGSFHSKLLKTWGRTSGGRNTPSTAHLLSFLECWEVQEGPVQLQHEFRSLVLRRKSLVPLRGSRSPHKLRVRGKEVRSWWRIWRMRVRGQRVKERGSEKGKRSKGMWKRGLQHRQAGARVEKRRRSLVSNKCSEYCIFFNI